MVSAAPETGTAWPLLWLEDWGCAVAPLPVMNRAIWQLTFGSLQIAGASAGLYLLITTGASALTIAAIGITGIVSLSSRVLFGLVWKKEK